ncbi:hypothetical protein B296_00019323 [Ensete ventricosum]|uniref:Uncharacterized protein n=1 Tax=Ensete ventricosum TaxID=4639 RepID=A0A427B2V7_ENSVE|nr:hypothetical protein B296_00019323 [Ensete ventricosum]
MLGRPPVVRHPVGALHAEATPVGKGDDRRRVRVPPVQGRLPSARKGATCARVAITGAQGCFLRRGDRDDTLERCREIRVFLKDNSTPQNLRNSKVYPSI